MSAEGLGDDRQLGGLQTEGVDPRYGRIDVSSGAALARLMNEADAEVPVAVARAMDQIVPAIEAVSARMRRGGRLRYVGAGTPGRIGILDASECPPTFGTKPDLVRGVMAGGPESFFVAQEGVEDDEVAGREAMVAEEIGPLDSVIGIASSGRTPFVLGAVAQARTSAALTVGLSCNDSTALSAAVDYPIEVVVGPEVVAGSTRLKAGSAQKLVLNMISTIAMVQMGKTYGNLMVDMRPSNAKLRARAIRIVRQVTGVTDEQALEALSSNGMQVKLAILRLELGLDSADGEARLAAVEGRLRNAMEDDR